MALWIVGLGLEAQDMTRRAEAILSGGARVVLRTGYCGAADWLKEKGIPFETLDRMYLEQEDFDCLAQALAQAVARMEGEVAYGVLDLRDESVKRLTALQPQARLCPGVPVEGPLSAWAMGPCQCFAASDLGETLIEAGVSTLVREIASPTLASEVKLALMARYPEEQTIYLYQGQGAPQAIALEDLDRQGHYDHRTSAFVPAQRRLDRLERMGFYELERVIRTLRGPQGCPWDRAQTHESLRPYVVEEAWEVCDAIDRGEPLDLCEELGDLLLQVSLHCDIARQYGEFTLDDVTSGICRKMLRRHPHVFGDRRGEDIGILWEEAKRREKGQQSDLDVLRGVAQGLPALMRAQKVLGKAAKAEKALPEARPGGWKDQEALGDALLALCEAARRQGWNAEMALKAAVDRFIQSCQEEASL